MPSSCPKLISHATIQHVDDLNFVNHHEPTRAPAPPLSNNLNEDLGTSNSNDDSLPFLGDPKPEFFGKTTPPSIHLIGAAAFKWLIYADEEEYTINIHPTSHYLGSVMIHSQC